MLIAFVVAVVSSMPAATGIGLEAQNGIDRGDHTGPAVEPTPQEAVVSGSVTSDTVAHLLGSSDNKGRSGSFTAVSAGGEHSCGLRSDGSIVCWGNTDFTQFGRMPEPTGSFTAVSAGDRDWCGLRSNGSLVCRGWSLSAPSGSFTTVSVGGGHGCGLRPDGSITCWGNNNHGQATVPSGSYTAVSAATLHSCGLRSDSSITCWGYNDDGQATAPSGSYTAVSAGGEYTWAGGGHSCGLRSDGSIDCWGYNEGGQATAPSGSYTAVSAGAHHSCGLRSDGSIDCWGYDWVGQATAPSSSYTAVSAGGRLEPGTWTHNGSSHFCGLRSDGSIDCWGYTTYERTSAPSGSYTAVSAGVYHSCGLRSDGSIVCWGYNDDGRLTPPSGSYTAVSAGGEHTCGLRWDGSITCWGSNWDRQAGTLSGSYTAVSAGEAESCGLRWDGSIVCWGDNWAGLLPSGSSEPWSSFTAVSAGGYLRCGLRSDGSILCWEATRVFLPVAGPVASAGTPATTVVSDDAGVHQPSVDALEEHYSGVFDGTGCETGLCPGEPLTRWEMAVWLVRILDRQEPAPPQTPTFDDVADGVWWAAHTQRLAELGITRGCSTQSPRFCPDQSVTRGEMAAFLVRAFDIPPGPLAGFADVEADSWYTANVDALAGAGVTVGCSTQPLRFCPDRSVTRGEMATFLARATDLIETPSP